MYAFSRPAAGRLDPQAHCHPPGPLGRLASGLAWRAARRAQCAMRSNWSTVSASMPNIRWHATLP